MRSVLRRSDELKESQGGCGGESTWFSVWCGHATLPAYIRSAKFNLRSRKL
jgi:hypothetical protein